MAIDYEKREKNLGKIERRTVEAALNYALRRRVQPDAEVGLVEIRNDALRADKVHVIVTLQSAALIQRHDEHPEESWVLTRDAFARYPVLLEKHGVEIPADIRQQLETDLRTATTS